MGTTAKLVEKVQRRVIPQWRSRLRDYSTIALASGTATVAAWTVLPADLKVFLPTEYVAWGIGALNAFGLGGKFLVQGPIDEEPK